MKPNPEPPLTALPDLALDATGGIARPTPEPQDPLLPSWRDTLVLSLRRGGFQGPQQAPTP